MAAQNESDHGLQTNKFATWQTYFKSFMPSGLFYLIYLNQSISSRVGVWFNFIILYYITDNPLYTDTRYNDEIRNNDNLTVTKPLLKR